MEMAFLLRAGGVRGSPYVSLTGWKKYTIKRKMMQDSLEWNLFSESDARFLLRHFASLMGPHGLYQHATPEGPILSQGYCVDDNARAVSMLIRLKNVAGPEVEILIEPWLQTC